MKYLYKMKLQQFTEVDRYDELQKKNGETQIGINLEVKQLGDEEDRVLRFIASSEHPDRDDDIIRVDGWKLDNFKKNPVILYMHNHFMPPIGKGINANVDPIMKKLMIDVKFPTIEELSSDVRSPHEHALFTDMIYNMYKNGYMKTGSVGFQGLKFKRREDGNQTELAEWQRGIEFLEQELFEFSLVTIPANIDSEYIAEAKSKGILNDDDASKVKKYADFFIKMENEKGALRTNGVVAFDPADISEEPWDAAELRSNTTAIELAEKSTIWNNLKEIEDLTKSDSKLPHHELNGNVSRQGMIAVKGAMLGARGGVKPFPNYSQEDFDKLIESGVRSHVNPHLKALEIDEIDIDEIKTIKFSKYIDMFKDYYDIDTLQDAYNSDSLDKAYNVLITKMTDPFGNPSSMDIERMIDNKFRREDGSMFAWVFDLYPVNYPNGHALVHYFEEEKMMMHSYINEVVDGESDVILGEGKEIEITAEFKDKSMAKVGAIISSKNREIIISALEKINSASELLTELIQIEPIEEEPPKNTDSVNTKTVKMTYGDDTLIIQ